MLYGGNDQRETDSVNRSLLDIEGIMKKVLVALPVVLLIGCGPVFNGPEQATYSQDNFPINVEAETVSADITPMAGKKGITAIDAVTVRSMASEYKQRGHGTIKVTAPAGNSADANAAVKSITRKLHAAGLSEAPVETSSSGPAGGPVMLSYTRYSTSVYECGLWDDQLSRTWRNVPNRNFGCATQNNLAAMLEDPYDLVEPRGMGPADADRRGKVLETYREGEVTASERSEEESGAVTQSVQ